jgi:hypothetical protein
MSTNHTPGPWSWGAAYGHHSVLIEAEGGKVVGTVRDCVQAGLDKHGMHVWQQTEEGRANARLVAAAPELLEALQLVRMSTGWQYLSDESRAVIDDALSKALGE